MAVVNANLQLRYTGTAGTAATSLGGAPSSTEVSTTALHNIFDEVSGDESEAGVLEYRTLVFHNASSTNTARNVKVHFEENYDSGDQSTITGLGSNQAGDMAITTSAAVNTNPPVHVAGTTPSGTGTWIEGTTRATGLTLGDVPAGEFRAVVLRRAVAAGASAQDNAEFELKMTADTGE